MNASAPEYDLCIAGAGISGLALASFIHAEQPRRRLLVLEQAPRAGGAIVTFRETGYLAEQGPHGFLDNCEESRQLVRMAGLEGEAVYAPLARFGRYLCLGGSLRHIPQTPWKVLASPLLPLKDKLRVLGDLGKPCLEGEPSVARWVGHRFGTALLPFADAAFTGTYAGDIGRLRIDAVMPGIRELERRHGSVIRGLIRRMRDRRQAGTKRKAMPSMTSFREGMEALPCALAAKLAGQGLLACGNGVLAVERGTEGWRVQTQQGWIGCRHLVLALPIWQSLNMLSAFADRPPVGTVPEARLASVLFGFDGSARIPFGFGYLAPEQEGRFALGALFSSHMFAGRAPDGGHLLEVLVGGRRHPERLGLSDRELIEGAWQDLRQLMRLPAPRYSAVLRPASGIPQFEEGYMSLLAWNERMQAQLPGLHLCGFGWKGIGINDMVKEAWRLARLLMDQEEGEAAKVAVKGIYF